MNYYSLASVLSQFDFAVEFQVRLSASVDLKLAIWQDDRMNSGQQTPRSVRLAIAWMDIHEFKFRYGLEVWYAVVVVEFLVVMTETGRPVAEFYLVDTRRNARLINDLHGPTLVLQDETFKSPRRRTIDIELA